MFEQGKGGVKESREGGGVEKMGRRMAKEREKKAKWKMTEKSEEKTSVRKTN